MAGKTLMRYYSLLLLIYFIFPFMSSHELPCEPARLFEKADFPIGTALHTDKLKYEEKYWTTALAQFNSFSPEKILKARFIHPRKDIYDFSELDQLIRFCSERQIRLHGHTLIWHKELPAWIEKYEGGSEAWDQLLKDHIQTIVKHCSTSVKSWDVVNEAFNEDGSLRQNIWLKNLGEAYIEKAFRYAAEAGGSAKLFYNDYGLEENGAKLSAVLKHLEVLKTKGIKVDGIGMQMHVSLKHPAIEAVNAAAQKIATAGFLVHYSELDVTLREGQSIFTPRRRLFDLQRERMKAIVQGYKRLDPGKRFGITLWGVSDNDSWLTYEYFRSRPLLFDTRYRIKPAYCGFLEGLGS